MTGNAQRFLPCAILLGGVLLVSGIREQHVVKPAEPMSAIPTSFMNLDGHDVVVPEEDRKVAGMTDYSMRVFGSDSNPAFSVYVAYYDRQVQGKSIHSPKNCLPGAGWDILTSTRVPAPSGTPGATVNRVLLANKGNRALVYYWYQGRGRLEASEYVVKWNLLKDAALHGRTEETLVRIVVPLPRLANAKAVRDNDADVQKADELSRTIAAQLEAAVQRVLPKAPA